MDEVLKEMAEAAGLSFAGSSNDLEPTVHTDEIGNLLVQWPGGIIAHVNNIEKSRDAWNCFISIKETLGNKTQWLLTPTRINLLSHSSRTNLRRELDSRSSQDWHVRLDQLVVIANNALSQQRQPAVLKPRTQELTQDYLIEPLVERGQHSMIVAAGGTGKSLLSLAICASLVSNKSLVPGLQPGWFTDNCLYLDWETDQATHERRLTQLCDGVGIQFPANRIHYIRMAASLPEDVPYLYEYIRKNKIGFIVVDSVGMATAGDMNSQQDAIAYVNAARALGDVTIMSIHHVGWGDSERNTGSRYFENAARSVWVLAKQQESGEPESHIDLTHRKSNNGIIRPTLGLKVEFGEAIRYYTDNVSEDKQSYSERILDALVIGRMKLTALYIDLSADGEKGKAAIRKSLERLVSLGKVVKLESGNARDPEYALMDSVTNKNRHSDVTEGSVTSPPPLGGEGSLSQNEPSTLWYQRD